MGGRPIVRIFLSGHARAFTRVLQLCEHCHCPGVNSCKRDGASESSRGRVKAHHFSDGDGTIILSIISLSGAVLIFMAVRAGFLSMVVNSSKLFDLEITPFTLLVFLVFGICTGILAGLLPAIYFSRLNPIEALRNASQ